jgi:DNA-binding transcriptional regulator YdaS (Cro superfamily)
VGMRHSPEHQAICEAVLRAGGQTGLAKALSKLRGTPVNQSTVGTWMGQTFRADPAYCRDIEAITGVTAERLRPDVFKEVPEWNPES